MTLYVVAGPQVTDNDVISAILWTMETVLASAPLPGQARPSDIVLK